MRSTVRRRCCIWYLSCSQQRYRRPWFHLHSIGYLCNGYSFSHYNECHSLNSVRGRQRNHLHRSPLSKRSCSRFRCIYPHCCRKHWSPGGSSIRCCYLHSFLHHSLVWSYFSPSFYPNNRNPFKISLVTNFCYKFIIRWKQINMQMKILPVGAPSVRKVPQGGSCI